MSVVHSGARTRGTPKSVARSVHVDTNGERAPVAALRLEAAALAVLKSERVPRAALSITLLSSRAMATMNRKHLGHVGPTDVITFGLDAHPGGAFGADIYICPAVARAQAKAHGVGVREELLRLVVHGVLHACGHDHPVDDSRTASAMWRRQEQLLARLMMRQAPRS
jgi:probable rRNA maturation factor